MAWTWRIDSWELFDVRLNVGVSYWDAADTQFTAQLWSTTLTYSPGTAKADVIGDIVSTGQAQRKAQQQRDAFLAAYPVGTTGQVP